jgi:ADP-dependent NAD(P)H-hydrate dehydratase / NAD(P)H-hydrate epimerase
MHSFGNKLLTASQIRDWDLYTIQHKPISSLDLMEKAALACVFWLTENFTHHSSFHILCGKGNNGGDGLSIAYHLAGMGKKVKIGILSQPETGSPDFESNLKRIKNEPNLSWYALNQESLDQHLEANELLVDALLGSGTNRTTSGALAQLIQTINQNPNTVISIDLPSGLSADQWLNNTIYNTIKADITLSLQVPKTSFFYPETGQFTGECIVVDIGLLPSFLPLVDSKTYHVVAQKLSKHLKTREKFAHKGNFGHALLMAGSAGKIGAALLSGQAALRSGVGLLTLAIPNGNAHLVHQSIPEAMVLECGPSHLCHLPLLDPYAAIGLGPGIGLEKETQLLIYELLKARPERLVVDADALTILAHNKDWISHLPPKTIITPHPKEFDRLFGNFSSNFERIEKQRHIAREFNLVLVLKGAHTSIALPSGELYFNTSGNPGMATGGSGDCLTGLLTALLAQHYEPEVAAVLGVYLHGLASDLALEYESVESLLPSDGISHFGKAFSTLRAWSN